MPKKSPSPITLTPPYYYPPTGRPKRKKKMHATELYDGMVKKGKLSRPWKTITYNKCTEKGVKPSTCASGSQPSGNTKKDKIRQAPSSTKKNEVEAHPRKVKSSLKNKDRVAESKGTAHVQHSMLNANSELKCVKCNGCILSANHDLCVLDFINNVNARNKSKSVKKNLKKKVWKPTGKVPKSVSANKKEPSQSRGSKVSNVPSSSLNKCKLSKLFSVKFRNDHLAKILGYGDYQIGNVTISKVYYVEGLGHNLFSVGHGLVRGLPKIKFEKDHLCSACAMGKSKKKPHKPKSQDTNKKTPIFTHGSLWTKACPQQNGVVERRNRTLIEAARTMLIYAIASLFLWTEAVANACYTKNSSIIRLRHGKTPYEILHDKPPDLSFFHVFGALCYPTNDSENLGKLQPKTDIGIFIGYAPTKKAFRIYNRRTRRIIETIHVDFDELTAMASEHSSSGPALHEMTPATISS
ncbi:integrase, catalytic region, zinc finger, CCHC-type containing protein [Tanacetum coccineum]